MKRDVVKLIYSFHDFIEITVRFRREYKILSHDDEDVQLPSRNGLFVHIKFDGREFAKH